MKELEHGTFHIDELIEMGNGNLEKGIEEINKKGWKIINEYTDPHTGGKFYSMEREKIDN